MFITPCNIIQGKVSLKDSHVFYKNNIRAHSKAKIIVGKNSIIQDLNNLHASENNSLVIGEKVLIGSNNLI